MKAILISCRAGVAACFVATGVALAQAPAPAGSQPIYRVTVVSRSLEAVNYEHRGGPTPIDFQGTVLLPHAKGSAIVESHRGSVAIDAKFDHLEPPTRFGREYLTYVLWAISPEGKPTNLGEVLADSSDHAHLKVTTNLQAFGLIVTAEPYYSVSVPSDVVVAENLIRPDTIGGREQVNVKYELMPRGQYTLNIPPQQLHSVGAEEPKLSYDRYEAVLELYQAENAIQIAKAQGADQYAADSMAKAKALLFQAQDMNARKTDPAAIVSAAREAAQMAEDARVIARKRQDEERRAEEAQRSAEKSELLHREQQDAAREQAQAREQADEAAQAARIEQARAQAAEAQARAAQQAVLAPPPPPPQRPAAVAGPANSQRQLRAQLFSQLNASFPTLDTPRGLVVTLTGDGLRDDNSRRLASVASIVSAHPGLRIRVEGYADTQPLSSEHAQAVREALIARGASSAEVSSIGYGDSRPLASNATAAGRERNRRVEVVIYGPSIGDRALWDRGYSLQSER